jgi:hypothetical protein
MTATRRLAAILVSVNRTYLIKLEKAAGYPGLDDHREAVQSGVAAHPR